MANRVNFPKILQSLRNFAKPHYSAAHSSITTAVPPHTPDEKPPHPIITDPPPTAAAILNLDDVKELFSSVSTAKLLRSAINLHAAAVEPMVDLGMWVMKSKLTNTVLLRELTLGVIKHTFYEHFCAGKDPAEAARTTARIWESGLRGMLAYALEHATDNESCDRNLEEFIQTVESAKLLPTSSVSFVAVKITAICPITLLKRVSDLLRWEYNNQSFHLPWKLKTLPIFSDSSPFYHTPRKPDPLTPEEETDLDLAQQRLQKLCQECVEANIPLAIDAENTSFQPAIDYLTYAAALVHNKDDNPIVYGTIQTYLKDAKERLFTAVESAKKMGVPVGIKLVRGAYLSSERQLASSVGVESPTHNTIDQTHASFNDCASFMLEKIASGFGGVVLSTHNIESGNKAAVKAQDLGIEKGNQKLQFAQLYGMADGLSFALKNAGFQVTKCMSFGPVELVIPFLLRRAEENNNGSPKIKTEEEGPLKEEGASEGEANDPKRSDGGDPPAKPVDGSDVVSRDAKTEVPQSATDPTGGNGNSQEEKTQENLENPEAETSNKVDALTDKDKRKKEVEEKLQILNAKKHNLVQVLKQILNAEEELKRRNTQGTGIRPSGPLQVDATNDSGSLTRLPTPRLGSDGNLGGDMEGTEADDASNHNMHSRHLLRMSSISPRSDSPHRRPAFSALPHPSRGSLPVAGSPSRFAPTGHQAHPANLPTVSVSATSYIASSPSPAASGGTSSFRDARLPSPWN